MLLGTYDSASQSFTVNTGGTSTLLAYDRDGDEALLVYSAIVLVGYVDTGASDTVVGAGTTSTAFTVVG